MIRNPIQWPNGARCACAITFDVDADSLIHIARPDDGHRRLYPISMGRYGEGFSMRALVQRFLVVLRRPALEILPRWKPRWSGAVYGESGLSFPATAGRGRRLEGFRRPPKAS